MDLGLLYKVSLILDVIIINLFAFYKGCENTRLLKVGRQLVVVVSCTVLASLLAIILPYKQISLFCQVVHYATTEWMLIYLMLFLEAYVGNIRATMFTRLLTMIVSAISSICLLLNPIFHHVVDSERVNVRGEMLYEFHTKPLFYDIHLYFCYFLVSMCLLTLATGAVRAVKLYRKKYVYALLMLVITVALDAFCTIKGYTHDFSLYGYTVMAFFFTYFAVYYKPKGVILQTLAYMVEGTHTGIVCFDPEDHCIFANEEVKKLNDEEVEPSFFEMRFKRFLDVESFKDADEKTFEREISVNEKIMQCLFTFGKMYDEKTNYIGCYFSVSDRTEEIKRYKQERYRATHDSLTDLHNREYFYERVAELLQDNADKQYYVINTDIKDFKLINDLFGYEKGNEILIEFAKILKQSMPVNSVCARLVSDRYALCIEKDAFDEDYIKQCIDDVQNRLSTSEFHLHIQAGVYEVKPEDTDVSVMCDRANMAIKNVKHDYEAVIVYYDEKLMNKVINSKHMISEFDAALEQGQFVMYLQPQVDTQECILGAEALVRWKHPEKGMVSPGEFIPVFEDAGLIHRLDLYVWEQAAKKLREWKDRGIEKYHISVNISTKDFYYLDLYKTFTELVEEHGIAPDMLKLEITETALMKDTDKQLKLIRRLQDYGFHVEIDDFGSGYSSLNMLKNLRADVLKIDMGFLQEIEDHDRTKVILGMVVDLAKRLKMTVITEGVETKNQVEYLTEVGCDMFQGYYFARPISVEEFERHYLDGNEE